VEWFGGARLRAVVAELDTEFSSDALMTVYKLVWELLLDAWR
jgi:hypothetical protein